jgi:hypothetical protein
MILSMLRKAAYVAIFLFCLPAEAQRLGEILGVKAWEGNVTVKGVAEGNNSSASGSDHWNLSWDADLQFKLEEYVAGGQMWRGKFTSGNVTIRHKNVYTSGDCVFTTLSEGAGFPVTAGSPDPIFHLYAGPGENYSFYALAISVTGKNTMTTACKEGTSTLVGPEGPLSWWPQNLETRGPFRFPRPASP